MPPGVCGRCISPSMLRCTKANRDVVFDLLQHWSALEARRLRNKPLSTDDLIFHRSLAPHVRLLVAAVDDSSCPQGRLHLIGPQDRDGAVQWRHMPWASEGRRHDRAAADEATRQRGLEVLAAWVRELTGLRGKEFQRELRRRMADPRVYRDHSGRQCVVYTKRFWTKKAAWADLLKRRELGVPAKRWVALHAGDAWGWYEPLPSERRGK